jgi:hypothetical protein
MSVYCEKYKVICVTNDCGNGIEFTEAHSSLPNHHEVTFKDGFTIYPKDLAIIYNCEMAERRIKQ